MKLGGGDNPNDSKKHVFLTLFLSVFAEWSACLTIDEMEPPWLEILFPTVRPYYTLQA